MNQRRHLCRGLHLGGDWRRRTLSLYGLGPGLPCARQQRDAPPDERYCHSSDDEQPRELPPRSSASCYCSAIARSFHGGESSNWQLLVRRFWVDGEVMQKRRQPAPSILHSNESGTYDCLVGVGHESSTDGLR